MAAWRACLWNQQGARNGAGLMKRLVLAEKPSVAREIARVLNCNTKNKACFEGAQYVVTWALGHLVTLAEPEDYDQKYREWRLEDLPMLPTRMKLKVIRQSARQFAAVKSLMQRPDISELVIATDAGREGELVARWIMALASWKKPFKRLWISSQTDAAIRDGFAGLKPGNAYDNLYDAAACRAEADWLIGLNVSRALTCKFNAQLTAGRVQTPTLAMIVQREQEIKEFKPVDYWTIRGDFGDYFGDWRGPGGSGRLFDHTRAEEIAARVRGQSGTIVEVKTEGKNEPPPLAYDLTELQRDANRRLGWTAQKTLGILQGLYERHKLVTYPRTDARYITTDIVPTLPARLRSMGVGPYAPLVAPLLQKPPAPGKRFVDNSKVSDHHAIIPTEQPLQLGSLTVEERNLYDLIARRFIAVLYPPYTYNQTTLITEVKGERFHSRGRVVKSQGWRAVTVPLADRDERAGEEALPEQTLAEQTLAEQLKGAVKEARACKVAKKQTKPPGRYTEATLLTAMENPGKLIEDEELREAVKQGGLGTPATRAEIIEKLIGHYYVERHGKELVPTSKGVQLVRLVAPALKTPELTARWEQSLAGIARGQESKRQFLTAIRQHAEELVQSVRLDSTTVYHADNISKTRCPACGKFMLLVRGRRGQMLVCQDRAHCNAPPLRVGAQWAPGGHRQPVDRDGYGGFRSSPGASRVNQKLIAQYSDQEAIGSNLGDLLKKALGEADDGEKRR
jgi:DNA topoisomerase-3